jgi:hypothetical protein
LKTPQAGAEYKPGGGIPLRALLVILALVLLAHWLMLGALPLPGLSVAPPTPRALNTRTVTLEVPKPEAPAKPVVPPKPAPVKRLPKPAVKPPPVVAAAPVEPAAPAVAPQDPVTAAPDTAPAPLAAASAPEPVAAAEPEAPRPPREAPAVTAVLGLPGSARLRFEATGEYKKLTYTAKAQMLWLREGSGYEFRHEVSAFMLGTRSQTSSGQITPEGLAPTRYAESLRSEVAAHFERDKGRVVFSANTPEAPLLAGAQDRLSLTMQLAAMFAGAPEKFPPATTITLPVVGPRDAELWLFTVEGEETIQLRDGPVQAVRVSRNPRKEFDSRIEVWFAPIMSYLPVRLKVTQSTGDFVDEKLLEIEKP